MSTASNLERQMLALINAERAKAGLAPVQLELRLNDAAETHTQWMLNVDQFSHTGAGGSQPWDRMGSAGFNFSGSWRATENIAWISVRGAPGLSDDVQILHNNLMNSPGHRANILDPNVTVVGIGIEVGNYNGVNAIMVTQNFARTSAPVQLDTGGTGQGGTPVPDPVDPAPTGPLFVAAGTTGTGANDWFSLKAGQSGRLDGLDGDDTLFGQNGADILIGRQGKDILRGLDGNDVLAGGRDDDDLNGGNGNDVLRGGGHNDKLVGATGHDQLLGGAGNDFLHGGSGNDLLIGHGGNDRLVGSAGNDQLLGGAGDDVMIGGSGADNFVFMSGKDRVKDFSDGDRIILTPSQSIANYSDLMNNHIRQSGNDVIIDDGQGNEMILENTTLSSLDNNDFVF